MLNRLIRFTFNIIYRNYASYVYKIRLGSRVYLSRKSIFEGRNFVGNNTIVVNTYMGYASYISENSVLKKCKIGRFSSLGPDIKCVFGKHPTKTFVSTHPAFFSTKSQVGFTYATEQLFDEYAPSPDANNRYSIIIGNDVWIGYGVTLVDGVTIGDGAIVAANSLVTKDVEPYSIVGGTPAKKIKYRFNKEDIDFLLHLKWWNKDLEWIANHSQFFANISKLRSHIQNTG